jgi:hypothetical protein
LTISVFIITITFNLITTWEGEAATADAANVATGELALA